MAQLIKGVVDTQKNSYRSIGQVNAADDLELELEVKMNGQPIEFINPECELLIKKSDNNRIRQTKDILYQDGKFKIKVDEQGVTYPGIVTCQLLTREDGRVSTCLFYFNVGTSLDREVLQSISKVDVLEELDEYVVQAFANLEEYEKRLDEALDKVTNGKDGTTFIPFVDGEGNISWSNDSGLTNPNTVNIKGPKGDVGAVGPQGPKGDTGPQGLPGRDGVDGVTPDMTEFENKINEQYDNIETKVTSVEERVTEIEKNGVGGGNASIDDNTISKTSTWSSEKIEDFVHTNDDVVWSAVQGENLSIECTKEGYLREVEIWGDTWQDSDSKNLLDPTIIRPGFINNDGSITAIENNWSTQNWRYSDYIKGLKEGQTYCLSGEIVGDLVGNHGFIFGFYDSKETLIQRAGRATSHNSGSRRYDTIIVPTGTVYTRIAFTVNDTDGVRMTKLMLEESSGVTDYVDYHKADLSDIRHLGELYVDEEGQPILDSAGREQYKIEVESINKNLIKPNIEMLKGAYHETTGVFTSDSNGSGRCTKEFIKVPTPGTYACFINTTINLTWFRVFTFDKDYNFIDCPISLLGTTYSKTFSIPNKAKFIKLQWLNGENLSTGDVYLTKSDTKLNEFIPHQSNKTTLLLPCQLMKVGNVADRLYWDSEKGKYVVEKNIGSEKLCDLTVGFSVLQGYEDRLVQGFRFYPCNKPTNVLNSLKAVAIVKGLKNDMTINDEEGFSFSKPTTSYVDFKCKLTKANLNSNDLVGVNEYFNKNNFVFFYTQNPQLIETNITEQILLQCYKDKTHLFVTGGIDGGIKAKVPLDGGQAIQSLSAKNIALNEEVITLSLENEELKSTNDTQDELINTTMLATDEMYMMLEPLLAETLSERSVSKMVDMYVAMVMRGLKTIEEVPARYREQVKEILAQLEK